MLAGLHSWFHFIPMWKFIFLLTKYHRSKMCFRMFCAVTQNVPKYCAPTKEKLVEVNRRDLCPAEDQNRLLMTIKKPLHDFSEGICIITKSSATECQTSTFQTLGRILRLTGYITIPHPLCYAAHDTTWHAKKKCIAMGMGRVL